MMIKNNKNVITKYSSLVRFRRAGAPIIALALLLSAGINTSKGQGKSSKPNILLIFLDDLGYGDLSITGNTEINTPNIDAIGNEGIQFPQAYSASPYCSPSRTALLTGRYPVRTGVNAVLFPTAKEGLPASEITIAEQLKTKGYTTGIIGKWHLGHLPQYLPTTQGFDYYFGIPFSNDMTPHYYIRNQEVLPEHIDQRFTTKRYTDEAIEFIGKNKDGPFFLYLPHTMPHVPLHVSPEFEGNSTYGRYGDVVQEIDHHIGRLLKALKDEGLEQNTLIIFTSDNGPWKTQGKNGGSSGIFRGAKAS
ncbi:MAG TPA: sulfatase-like hydrolase/transferase, partial [Cytophagaceae bacterium]